MEWTPGAGVTPAAPRAAVGGEVFREDVFSCGSVTETGFHGFLFCIRVNCSALSGGWECAGKRGGSDSECETSRRFRASRFSTRRCGAAHLFEWVGSESDSEFCGLIFSRMASDSWPGPYGYRKSHQSVGRSIYDKRTPKAFNRVST
jgi:hypothetical protein